MEGLVINLPEDNDLCNSEYNETTFGPEHLLFSLIKFYCTHRSGKITYQTPRPTFSHRQRKSKQTKTITNLI